MLVFDLNFICNHKYPPRIHSSSLGRKLKFMKQSEAKSRAAARWRKGETSIYASKNMTHIMNKIQDRHVGVVRNNWRMIKTMFMLRCTPATTKYGPTPWCMWRRRARGHPQLSVCTNMTFPSSVSLYDSVDPFSAASHAGKQEREGRVMRGRGGGGGSRGVTCRTHTRDIHNGFGARWIDRRVC